MHRLKKKRFYNVLIILGIASTIFLCFQLFSVQMLHKQKSRDKLEPRIRKKFPHDKPSDVSDDEDNKQEAKNPDSDCKTDDTCKEKKAPKSHLGFSEKLHQKLKQKQKIRDEIRHNSIISNYKKDSQMDNQRWMVAKKQATFWEAPDDSVQITKDLLEKLPRGVPWNLANFYETDSQQEFICIQSGEVLSFSQVNDDYCDCQDGSDEPGTAACENSRFYCKFQLSTSIQSLKSLKWLHASKVNDGICDCCDGSDEWSGVTVNDDVKLEAGVKYYNIWQAPCFDRCAQSRAEKDEKDLIRREGAELKDAYLREGLNADQSPGYYGPEGLFYKLSKQCYTGTNDKYQYTLCPFKQVKQEHIPDHLVVIGRNPEWISASELVGYKLRMTGGDPNQCPDRKPRQSVIEFECGLADRILNVYESEPCVYSITMSTPAAC